MLYFEEIVAFISLLNIKSIGSINDTKQQNFYWNFTFINSNYWSPYITLVVTAFENKMVSQKKWSNQIYLAWLNDKTFRSMNYTSVNMNCIDCWLHSYSSCNLTLNSYDS